MTRGCAGCARRFTVRPGPGRPRRYCTTCRPPMRRATDDDVTPVQRLYLDAFDRFLRTGEEMDEHAKDCFLDAMYWERRLIPPSLRPDRHVQMASTSATMRAKAAA